MGHTGTGQKVQSIEALAPKSHDLSCPLTSIPKLWVTHVPAHEMLGINPLLDVSLAKVFSHFVGHFACLTVSFAVEFCMVSSSIVGLIS